MIAGNDNSNSPTGLRQLGFQSVFKDAPIFHLSGNLSAIRKEMEIKMILKKEKPDAIFLSDDLTAILTLKIIKDLKLKVPQDIKIIGYDGTHFVEHFYPFLTTIKQPIEEIADLLVDVLLKKIDCQKIPKDYILPVSLLSGQSI